MFRQPRPPFTRRRGDRRAPWCLRRHGLGSFSRRFIHPLQQEQQWRGIELLAFRAEELPHQEVNLLPPQCVFLLQGSDSPQEFRIARRR